MRHFVKLIKDRDVEHRFLEASKIEMDITDEVRRQNHLVFPADKIPEQ